MSEKHHNSLKEIMQMLDQSQFDPKDHIVNPGDLPPAGKVKDKVDYEASMLKIEQIANAIVETIVKNYVISEKWLNTPKVKSIYEQQAMKLAELQFLVNSCRDGLMSLQESLDSGDINPELFRMKKDYIKEMRDSINERSKHISEIEKYWESQASKYEVDSTKESQELASDKEAIKSQETIFNESDSGEEKTIIMDIRQMNDNLEKFALMKKAEDDLKRKEKEANQ